MHLEYLKFACMTEVINKIFAKKSWKSILFHYVSTHLYRRHCLCPVWWTVCCYAMWKSLQRCHGSGPPAACSSRPPTRYGSWRTLRTSCVRSSPPRSPAACRCPGSSASRCFPGLASIHHQCFQILAVKGEIRVRNSSTSILPNHELIGNATAILVFYDLQERGCFLSPLGPLQLSTHVFRASVKHWYDVKMISQ